MNKSVFKTALDFDVRQLSIAVQIIAVQKAMLAIVKTAMPDEIAKHVQHCVVSGKSILIYTDSANWASQIRFFNVDILNKIAASGQQNIIKMQVRICPPIVEPQLLRKPQLPSAENIGLIGNQAGDAKQKDELQLALIRLGKTLEKRLGNRG